MKFLALLSALSLLSPSVSLANEAQQEILRQQREQMQELNTQLQIQANQRQIERLQREVAGRQPRQPNPAPFVAGLILGTVLNNSSVVCYNGRCGYGYRPYRPHYHPYPYRPYWR